MEDGLHDVLVAEFFEQTDFANGGAGDSFLLRLETNLLESDNTICLSIKSPVHDAIGSC